MNTEYEKQNDSPTSWFEKPANVWMLIIALCVCCVGLVIAEQFFENPHPHFPIEKQVGFQAAFGFIAFVTVVFLGRILRLFVKRREDYYDV